MRIFSILVLFVLIGVAGCDRKSAVEVPADGIIRLSEQFSSDFSLIDENGQPFTNEDVKGSVAIVYFGFATCPDVCPLALGTLSAALNELDEGERNALSPLFITVDPERDTPEIVKTYLSSFHEDIRGLSGTVEAVDQARQSFKVFASKELLNDSAVEYTMNHTSLFYVIDKKGKPALALRDTLSPQQLAEMLRRSIK